MHNVIIKGCKNVLNCTVFEHNPATSIEAYNTGLQFEGNVVFSNDYGVIGGTISLHNSLLIPYSGYISWWKIFVFSSTNRFSCALFLFLLH